MAVQRNFRVAKVAQRHAIRSRVYIGNTPVCTDASVKFSHAPKRAEEVRAFVARSGAARRTNTRDARTHGKMTGQDVFELDSTRKYFTRANTRRDGSRRVSSCSLAARAARTPREFSSSFRYVIHQMSKRFRARGHSAVRV